MSVRGWRPSIERRYLSAHDMTWIACMVAVDVTKYSKEDVRHMLERTSYDSVREFFTSYSLIFGTNVANQLNYLYELGEEE